MISEQHGRAEIGDAFGAFLARFDTVFHLNGQQVVEINGDSATGTAYCFVVLIGEQNGKRIMTEQGTRYTDEYKKVGGKWLIANRRSEFMFSKSSEVD